MTPIRSALIAAALMGTGIYIMRSMINFNF